MGSPLVNPGSAIISAYLEGRAQRAQREQAAAQRELQQQQLMQREQEAQAEQKHRADVLNQQIKADDQRNSILQQQLAATQQEIANAAKRYDQQHKISTAQLRLQDLEALGKGTTKFPTHQDWVGMAGEAPIPGQARDKEYNPHPDIEGYNPIQATEVPEVPLFYAQKQAELEARKEMAAATNERYRDIAELNAKVRANALEQARMLGMARIAASGQKQDAKGLQQANSIIQRFAATPVTKAMQKAQNRVDFLQHMNEHPEAPDVNDTALVFMWVNGFDDTKVSDQERQMAMKIGASWLEQKGIQVNRIFNRGKFLTPEATAAIKDDIRTKARAAKQVYDRAASGVYSQITNGLVDMTPEQFSLELPVDVNILPAHRGQVPTSAPAVAPVPQAPQGIPGIPQQFQSLPRR